MKHLKIIVSRVFLALLCFGASCTLSPLFVSNFLDPTLETPQPEVPVVPETPKPEVPAPDPSLPPSVLPESFFIELHMKGESPKYYFRQVSANAYPDGVEFQIMDLYLTFASYYGRWWVPEDQCHQLYGYSGIVGNYFDLKRYVGHPNLKTIPSRSPLHLYYWIKRNATSHNFGRDDLYLTVPTAQFDSNIHTNIARFTVTFYPDYGDPRPDEVVFDGFVSK